ncbi:MAG: Rne/Rng family ribonuclease [Vampirovibrionales bacterium]|nr:Rne/Rng family ribonuclease [Vampirovibrionales bacterium]
MPKRKIVVSERDNIAALFEDDKAVEFIIHRGDMLLGDVYLSQVENVLPSIDAGFVNVGSDKMGFLHNSDVQGKGDLRERLKPKQRLVVQVMKEPTGHKGPRVTTNISLPGRFLVLMPESRGISISRKVESAQERNRLKSVVSLLKPSGVGIIIRTEAENQRESDLKEDFETLMERWQTIVSMADTGTPPMLLYRDQDLLYRVIRENVTEDVEEIVVDTPFGYQRAQQLVQNWRLERHIKLTHYQGTQSIMVSMGVEREIRQALQTKVPLSSGGYLYIQPTEALCVVDVNSGKFTSLQSQAETIRITNLEATKEIARQLRLRNVGGMVVVDFIDMESRADQLAILEAFEQELASDKAKPQLGQLTDLGLVEMTRHRQGQSLMEIFAKQCIACNGSGQSLEEFNWAPPGVDDPRANERGNWKSRLPLRQLRAGQGQAGGKSGAAADAGLSGQALLAQSQQRHKGAAQEARMADKRTQAENDRSGRRPGQQGPNLPQKSPEELKGLDELIADKLLIKLGLKFALTGKFGVSPSEPNAILSRMNPKANDIMTLVAMIEGGEMMMPQDDFDDDYNGGADDGDDAPEAMKEAPGTARNAGKAGNNRNNRFNKPNGAGAPDEAQAERGMPRPKPGQGAQQAGRPGAPGYGQAPGFASGPHMPLMQPAASSPVIRPAVAASPLPLAWSATIGTPFAGGIILPEANEAAAEEAMAGVKPAGRSTAKPAAEATQTRHSPAFGGIAEAVRDSDGRSEMSDVDDLDEAQDDLELDLDDEDMALEDAEGVTLGADGKPVHTEGENKARPRPRRRRGRSARRNKPPAGTPS